MVTRVLSVHSGPRGSDVAGLGQELAGREWGDLGAGGGLGVEVEVLVCGGEPGGADA